MSLLESGVLSNGNTRSDDLIRTKAANANAFVPDATNTRAYRDALGQFGTGVTIVTAATDQGPIGMTVNSFASVSLTPALVLWSLAKSSGRFAPFRDAQHYAIHILHEDQADLATAFARHEGAFERCDWDAGNYGVPHIADCLTRFDCAQSATHDAGDHTIIVGQVENVMCGNGKPLLFAQGEFGQFATTR